MARIDHTYHDLLEKILQEGYDYKDESRDIICKQISSYEFRHNIRLNGFPAITTKKLYWKGVVGELIWFLKGDTNIKYLVDNNIHIWDKDAYNWYKKEIINRGLKTPLEIEEYIRQIKNSGKLIHYGFQYGDLGRVYGAQWRKWLSKAVLVKYDWEQYDYLDQISNLIQNLKDKPMSRRHIVTAWNPAELDDMALPPCHWSFEIIPRPLTALERGFYDRLYRSNCGNIITAENLYHNSKQWDEDNIPKYMFDLKWHQRSVDTFLGLPFNIASYGLLMEIIGKMTNMIPNELIGDLSNVHIYYPHIDAVKTQLKNQPAKYWRPLRLRLAGEESNQGLEKGDVKIFDNLQIRNFRLEDYESYPTINAEMLAPK